MLSNRSSKEKLAIVVVGIVVLIWLSYQFSFSRTIDLWTESKKLENQKDIIKEIPGQLPFLRERMHQVEKILGNTSEEDFSVLILEQVNQLCQQNNVVLKEIPEKHQFNGTNIIIETLNIDLQGRFRDQILVILQMEKIDTGAKLHSIKFQSVVNQSTGERSLQSTLFLQSIKLLSNNFNTSGYEKIDK